MATSPHKLDGTFSNFLHQCCTSPTETQQMIPVSLLPPSEQTKYSRASFFMLLSEPVFHKTIVNLCLLLYIYILKMMIVLYIEREKWGGMHTVHPCKEAHTFGLWRKVKVTCTDQPVAAAGLRMTLRRWPAAGWLHFLKSHDAAQKFLRRFRILF